jgi:S-formylglutathione hydrolase
MSANWSATEIGSKIADIYEPAGKYRPRFGVLHLHGSSRETLRGRSAFTRWFDELNLVCICPHGARCWWGDRLCSEFDAQLTPERYLLDVVLPYFKTRWGISAQAVGLQGVSMGGQGALRLAFKHPDLFPVVAALAAAIDYHELYGQDTLLEEMYDSKEQCRQDTVPLHVHPVHFPAQIFFAVDPEDVRWYRGNDRLHEKLIALGIPHEIDFQTRAGSHSWQYYDHMAEHVERFIHAGLEIQSRRLL